MIILLTGCLGSKSVKERFEKSNSAEITKVEKDSLNDVKTSVNKEIKDNLVIDVGNSGSKECDDKIDEILKRLNTSKTSGSNSYSSRYNEDTRQILIDFIVAQTKDKETTTSVNKEFESEKTFEQETSEKTKKVIKMLPWWVWIIVAFLLRKQIISVIAVFYPPIKGIKTIADLFTPPNN